MSRYRKKDTGKAMIGSENSGDVDSVVKTVKEMVSCSYPCSAKDDIVLEDEDLVDYLDSFYTDEASEISGLKPFALPLNTTPGRIGGKPLLSTDSIFSELAASTDQSNQLQKNNNMTLEVMRDMPYDTVHTQDSTVSLTMITSNDQAPTTEEGTTDLSPGEWLSSPCHRSLASPVADGRDKYLPVDFQKGACHVDLASNNGTGESSWLPNLGYKLRQSLSMVTKGRTSTKQSDGIPDIEYSKSMICTPTEFADAPINTFEASETGWITTAESNVINVLSIKSPKQSNSLEEDEFNNLKSFGTRNGEGSTDVDSEGELLFLATTQPSFSHSGSLDCDEEMMVVVEVEHAESRLAEVEKFREMLPVNSVDSGTIATQSILLGIGRNDNEKKRAISGDLQKPRCKEFIWEKKYWLCGFIIAAIVIVGLSAGLAAEKSNRSVTINSQVAGDTSAMPSFSSTPTLTPSTPPTNSPSRQPSYISSAIPTTTVVQSSMDPTVIRTGIPSTLPSTEVTPFASPSSTISDLANALGLYLPSNPNDPLHRALEWAIENEYPPSRQRIALASIFFGTIGETWRNGLLFLSDDDECNWSLPYMDTFKGVRCSDAGDVIILSLFDNGLRGEIPKEVRLLSQMNMLWLNDNDIGGSLPSQLGRLTSLEYFDLSENALSGPMPTEIGNMQNLREVNIRNNYLNGPIPQEISQLAVLEHLWTDGNLLTGDLTGVCDVLPSILLSADCDEVACPCCVICCDISNTCTGAR